MSENPTRTPTEQALADLLEIDLSNPKKLKKVQTFTGALENFDEDDYALNVGQFEIDYRKDGLPPLRLRLTPDTNNDEGELRIKVSCGSNITTQPELDEIEWIASELQKIVGIPCVSTAIISKRQN